MPNQKLKANLLFFVKFLVSSAILWFALRQIDMKAFTIDMRQVRPWWLTVAVLQVLLIPPLGGARWMVVLRALGYGSGLAALTRAFWTGMVFNQVLPSASGGDAIRVLLAWRLGIPTEKAIYSVILERMAILLTLAVVVQTFQPVLLHYADTPTTRLVPPVLLAALIVGYLFLMSGDRICRHLPPRLPLKFVSRFSADVRKVFLARAGVSLVLLCLLTNLNLSVASLWLGKSLGLTLTFLDYVVFIPIVTLITTLPISIGGWGVREGATVVLFGALGVVSHNALAFSVLFGLVIAVSSLPGLIFLWFGDAESNDAHGVRDDA
jgi:glycosyltransferase 2 family protein